MERGIEKSDQTLLFAHFPNNKYLFDGSETIIEVQSSDFPLKILFTNFPYTDNWDYALQEINGEEILRSHDLQNGKTVVINQPVSNNTTTLKISTPSTTGCSGWT